MSNKILIAIIIILILIIAGLFYYFLFFQKGEKPKWNLIRLEKPQPNELIKSPLEIKGEARGSWFFEADFPIKLIDDNGNNLGIAIAQTQSDWMTEDFVPFEALLEFSPPQTKRGTLILEKDNPSGLPENADELRIPVKF